MCSKRNLQKLPSIYQQLAAARARIDGAMLYTSRERLALGSVVRSTILFIFNKEGTNQL